MMDSLQIPDSIPGPSRQQPTNRPVSVQPYTSPASPSPPHTSSSRKQRASHTVTSGQQQDEGPTYRDVYSHPAAIAYAANHPRRTIPKFGPYLLLQTLGEGEFGKVKLGLHTNWGEEVAVKLIKRHNIDSAVRMSKVEREIEVLRMLKHPNIVRLYDVIETDKYIGIILDYASGGELFDHILAHRYLKEKDACKLFSQLISGVGYIHQRKIVHRDLKLENLLLDRNRNVIITDFGFANRFEHRADDLMQTSCGSPCYAAPELVISEGSYVGSAVDIWSCGVILYAMLAGYLPFDDDPANPDGDNINLLYKYIVNTPLSFPDYISVEARDLLSIMLQPDPQRRASLSQIMQHRWLAPYRHVFEKSVEELESIAMEQHRQKRLAYQRQMRNHANAEALARERERERDKVSRSQSERSKDMFPHASVAIGAPAPSSRSKSTRDPVYTGPNGQPEYLYETSAGDQTFASEKVAEPEEMGPPPTTRRGYTSATLPSVAPLDDDPFAPGPGAVVAPIKESSDNVKAGHGHLTPTEVEQSIPSSWKDSTNASPPAVNGTNAANTGSTRRKGEPGRHTIQVEYGEPKEEKPLPARQNSTSRRADQAQQQPQRTRQPSAGSAQQALYQDAPVVTIDAASPPATPAHQSMHHVQQQASSTPGTATNTSGTPSSAAHVPITSSSNGSVSSRQGRHRKGISLDKMGFGKIFGGNSSSSEQSPNVQASDLSSRQPSESSTAPGDQSSTAHSQSNGYSNGTASRRPSTLQVTGSGTDSSMLLSPVSGNEKGSVKEKKKDRRNTLTVMVDKTIGKTRSKGRNSATTAPSADTTLATPLKEKEERRGRDTERTPGPMSAQATVPPSSYTPGRLDATPYVPPRGDGASSMQASTSKARKVMQWFRSRSKGPGPDESAAEMGQAYGGHNPSSTSVNNSVNGNGLVSATGTISSKHGISSTSGHPKRSVSESAETMFSGSGSASHQTTPSITERFRRSVRTSTTARDSVKPVAAGVTQLRVHHGAVDAATTTTGNPPEVMSHVRKVLEEMGIEIQIESEYKYRCVRVKRGRLANGVGVGLGLGAPVGANGGVQAVTMVGSAASNGVDKRGLPLPSNQSFGSTGGMLKGLLMRRQSSQTGSAPSGISSSYYESDSAVDPLSPENTSLATIGSDSSTVYGDATQDAGDEVRFSVELTRLDRLNDTFSLDIRRLKGNLRSYKFLYDCTRDRLNFQR